MSQSSAQTEKKEPIQLTVENVGGIDNTEVTFTPGVMILVGRNATNRTSLLRALMAVLGSERVSLKGDAQEGHVELTIDETTYTRTLTRAGDSNSTDPAPITTGGEPYVEDAELADLFAFLLETNEARQSVARSDDLRELIMRPVDTDTIQAEIDNLDAEKRDLNAEIDQLETLEDRLPELEAELSDLDERIEEKREDLEATETDLDEADADVEETRDEKEELDGKLDELSSARSAIEEVRLDIETERQSIAGLREEKGDLEDGLDSPSGEGDESASPAAAIDEIDAELKEYRDRVQELETTINELQTIIGFNEDMLGGESASTAVLNILRDAGEESDTGRERDRAGALTDQLLADSDTVCWTCGSEVDQDRIEATLDRLREVRTEYFDERRSLRGEIDELEDRKREIESQQRQREQRQRELQNIEAEIDDREARLDDLEHKRKELGTEVEDLESEVENIQAEEYNELLDLHKRANQLEFELGRLQREREEASDEIESVERRLAEREQLEAQREQLQSELTDLRGRIERIEERAIEEFNSHMETVLELLDYANIARIWLERRETQVRKGRRKVTKSVFDLHVIRSTESDATYEDTISHLSESEREVTGLVFALAGYLAHDLYESMPFVLLDSLETIDSDRIAALVEYFGDYAEYVVIALLPEDARALGDEHERITEI